MNRSLDGSLVVIDDSPTPLVQERRAKRKLSGTGDVGTSSGSPKHPLLDSIGNRFRQNREEQSMRVAVMQSKRETERQHARYIKDNIACPTELARAGYVVNEWAKKHGVKTGPPKNKRRGRALQTMNVNQLPSRLNNTRTITPEHMHNKRNSPPSHNNTAHDINTPPQASTHHGNTAICTSTTDSNDISEFLSSRDDLTDDDLIILDNSVEIAVNESLNDSVILINTSNNSNTASPQPDSPTEANTSATSKQSDNTCTYTCPILNCEAEFTTEAKLGHHTNMFCHSPCNPYLRMLDGKLHPEPIIYICPQCDKQFKSSLACQDHMRSKSHQQYLPPLAIAGYFCAQCLCVFESFESCWLHIERSNHHDVSYPFADDLATGPSSVGPVRAPEELVRDFVLKCQQLPFNVQCLECSLDIDNPAVLRQHAVETNQTHLMSSLADTSIVDVFAGYLAGYCCDTCSRLAPSITTTIVHQCAPGVTGHFMESNVKSFSQFVKCCALTLTKSVATPITRRSPTIPKAIAGTSTGVSGIENVSHSREKGAIPKTSGEKDTNARKSKARMTVFEEGSLYLVPSSESELDLSEPLSTDMVNASTSTSQTRGMCNLNTESHSYKRKRTENDDVSAQSDQCFSDLRCRQIQQFSYQPRLPEPALNVLLQGQRDCRPNSVMQGLGLVDTMRSRDVPRLPLRKPLQPLIPNVVEPSQKPGDDCSQLRGRGRHKSGPPSPRDQEVEPPKPGPSRHRQKSGPPANTLQVPDGARRDRSRSRSPLGDSPISTANLSRMNNIIFLDLDNWAGFFSKLPRCLPDLTFVWGFYGGKVNWYEPGRCYVFNQMKNNGMFYLHEKCGATKDAADFAIVLQVGIMNERLPKNVAFTILSGDKGFCEVERQMKDSERRTVLINPHKAHEFSNDMVYAMVTSVSET